MRLTAQKDYLRSFKKKTFYVHFVLWALVVALLLASVPQKAAPPLPELCTAKERWYPLFASLSFVCFAKEISVLSLDGAVLKRKEGKAAKGEALLLSYPSDCEEAVTSAQAAENAEAAPSKNEITALLCAYRQGDGAAKQMLEEKIRHIGQAVPQSEPLPAPSNVLYAEQDGYFVQSCDGYEYLDGINPATVEIAQLQALKRKADASGEGKLYTSQTWYGAAVTNIETAAEFSQKKTYQISYAGKALSAALASVRTQGEEAVLIFEFYGIPEGGIPRTFKANVTYRSVHGMRIPKSAIFEDGGVLFVRVYAGEAVWLRVAEIVSDCGKSAIVKGGESVTYQEKKRYPLKAGEGIYINYQAEENER